MEHLQHYSSSEEEEDANEAGTTSTHPSTPVVLSQPFFNDLDIYSQNYLMNQKNMVSAFIYIPWSPSAAALNQLKQISNNAIFQIKKNFPTQSSIFNWHYVGSPMAMSSGKFSVTNKHNLSNLHITVSNNIHANAQTMKTYIGGVTSDIQLMNVHSTLINSDTFENSRKAKLNSVLGINPSKTSNQNSSISLKFGKTLKVYKNKKTGNLFISGVLSREGPQAEFLDGLQKIITDHKLSLNLPTTAFNEWHISLVVGEYKGDPINQRKEGNSVDIDELIGWLKLDDSSVLDDIRINIDKLVINVQAASRKDVEIRFPTEKRDKKRKV